MGGPGQVVTLAMRPERRACGPSVDIGHAEVVADVFRGLEDLDCGMSVCVAYQGQDYERWSMTISLLGWRAFSAWLRTTGSDRPGLLRRLEDGGWINTAIEHEEADRLLRALREHIEIWSEFVDPDEPDLIELVIDL